MHLRFWITGTLLFGLALMLVPDVQADGWPQRKGHGYYKMGFRMMRATSYYEPGGGRIDIPTLGDYTVSFYGEYGITNRITAVAYVPFFERITLNKQIGEPSGFVYFEGDAISGVADPEVGVRVGLYTGHPTVVSLSAKLGVPIGTDDQPNGLYTGDGEMNQKIALEVGHSFYPRAAYMIATAGFNNRVNGYSDEFFYGFEAGYTFAQKVLVLIRLRGVESLENGDVDITGGTGGLSANNQRYLSYGVEVNYQFTDAHGVSVGIDSAFFGQNVLAAPAFSAGFFLTL